MSYITGTYGIKYFKQFVNERGKTVRLEIHCRNYSGTSYEIYALNGLSFDIQGAQEDPETPIIKTSLNFGLIDDPFIQGAYSDGRIRRTSVDGIVWARCANWKEFYTPDSTLYLVKLIYDGRLCWQGYVTPDSYSESLDSHGTVNITARDNLGHLKDFDFDAPGDSYGLINILELIRLAMTKISFPLNVLYSYSRYGELRSEDGEFGVDNLCVCVDAFKDKTWFEALEETLNSVGWCMRFCDVNGMLIGPLRFWSMFGWGEEDDWPSEDAVFLGRNGGTRTFNPAYKKIVEKINFGQEDKVELDMEYLLSHIKTSGNYTHQYIIEYSNDYGSGWNAHTSVQQVCDNTEGGVFPIKAGPFKFDNGFNVLNPKDFALQDVTQEDEGNAARNYLFIAANLGHTTGSGTSISPVYDRISKTFSMKVLSPALKFEFEFAEHPMCFYDGKLGVYPYNLKKIVYQIKYTSADGATERYWNGYTWIAATSVLGVDLEATFDPLNEAGTKFGNEMTACQDCGAYGTLEIIIERIQYQAVGGIWTQGGFSYLIGQGCWARLRSFYIESKASKVMKSDTVTTVVNENYNIKCERNPMFGCMPQSVGFAFPSNYLNAFFVYNSSGNPIAAPYKWKWSDDTVALPFPAKIHQQLLMFHYTTHEVLEGNAQPDNYQRAGYVEEELSHRYDCTIGYKGIQHLLLSVTHNLVTDRFSTCILRSFSGYRQLWTGNETQ